MLNSKVLGCCVALCCTAWQLGSAEIIHSRFCPVIKVVSL